MSKKFSDFSTPFTQHGFSIVEVLVAIVISMILIAGILQILINSKNNYRLEDNFSDMSENSRFTSEYLARIIRLTGYRSPPDVNSTFPEMSAVFSTTPYINGTEASGFNSSDSITVSYEGSGNGAGTPDGTIRDCLNRPIDANVIASNTFFINSDRQLVCQAVNPSAAPANSTLPLVAEVENFQVLYGEDTNGNNVANRYVRANFPDLDMSRVVSVRLGLIFRSEESLIKPTPSRTFYVLGESFTPTTTDFLRQHLTFTVVLRNLLSNPI